MCQEAQSGEEITESKYEVVLKSSEIVKLLMVMLSNPYPSK